MVTVIAEAGNAHEGFLDAALELVERAKEAGADLVKFQAGTAEDFARSPEDIPRYRKYELGRAGYEKLIDRGTAIGIPVFFSVWSDEFNDLRRLPYFKIAARQCRADYIAKYATDNTFISIPLTLVDVKSLGLTKGIALHCVPHYPAINGYLWRIPYLRRALPIIPVGYSDHTIGIDWAVRAVNEYGACVIEKHFTLRRDFGPLRDHVLSATPGEMKELVEKVKN